MAKYDYRDLIPKTLDWYIIKKFLGTFFFSIVLILSIGIVFDISENLDEFYDSQVPLTEIVFSYYLNFIPYYFNMFSPLFIFISVIFFTSKMAGNSEIIAMLASGISFHRIMWPYFISSSVLFVILFILGGYVIPPATAELLHFKDTYIRHFTAENASNVQMEVEPGTILYIENYHRVQNVGYRVSLEHFEGKTLTQRTTADRICWDTLNNWYLENYVQRNFEGMRESMRSGERLDTIIRIEPEELFITSEMAQQMTNPELTKYIEKQQKRGAGNVQAFENEWHKRFASPIGVFIMTILGVTMSCKKVRGGMGKNLGIGIGLSAIYILFSTVSSTFSVTGVMSPFMSAWLPNFIFLIIGAFTYLRVPK